LPGLNKEFGNLLADSEVAALDQLLQTPEFLHDPYPVFRRLRDEQPIYFSKSWNCWLLSRYEHVVESLRDHQRFSNIGTTHRFLDQLPQETLDQIQPLYEHFSIGLTRCDPPDHTRLRGLTNVAFTPRVVGSMRDRIQTIVDQLIDAVSDQGRLDLIRDFAYPLPATIIAEMFGFPVRDRDQFKAWSTGIAAFHGSGSADPQLVLRSQQALLAARQWLRRLIDERRRNPTADLLSRLANAAEHGETLTDPELFSICVTFLIGGHETTTNLIGNGMLALLRSPEQLRILREDADLIPSAVEEMLRYDAPTQRAHRIAAEDIEWAGQRIRQGDFVQLLLGSANRDPQQFEKPDQFDVLRTNHRHVSFGMGAHFCPGAPLARLEAQIAIGTLLRRLPNLRLDPDETIEWSSNNFFRGLQRLQLIF